MSHRSVILVAVLLAACAPQGPEITDAARDAATRGVRDTVERLFDALNAHDADRVLSHYQKSDDFAYIGVTDVEIGWETFAMRTRQWHMTHTGTTFEHQLLHVHVLSPTVAVAIVRGSSSDAPQLTWTYVFVRDGGDWKIAHEHEAWPGSAPRELRPHPGT